MTNEYKYFGIHFYTHGYFEPISRKATNHNHESLDGHLKEIIKKKVIGVTWWKLKSRLWKVLVLPTFTYGTEIWGGNLKNSHWKVFEKGTKMHMSSHVKMRSLTPTTFCCPYLENLPYKYMLSGLLRGFQQQLAPYSNLCTKPWDAPT